MSVSTGFNFNSIEVPSSTVCDMGRYFHNLSLRKSSFQSKGGEYRLSRVLQYCFFWSIKLQCYCMTICSSFSLGESEK